MKEHQMPIKLNREKVIKTIKIRNTSFIKKKTISELFNGPSNTKLDFNITVLTL